MKLTGVGRIALGLVVAALLGLGYYYFGDKLKDISAKDKAEAADTYKSDESSSTATAGGESSSTATAGGEESTTSSTAASNESF